MATVIKKDGGFYCHVKGASEIVLSRCTQILKNDGGVETMTQDMRTKTENLIENMAENALRTICIAYRQTQSSYSSP